MREAVVNAFKHRDYRTSDVIRVEHDASRLRVTSPGGFVPGVSVDNVLRVSSRSRILSAARASRLGGRCQSQARQLMRSPQRAHLPFVMSQDELICQGGTRG